MAKNNKAIGHDQLDQILELEQPDYWDIHDPSDQLFWDEFFKIEEVLNLTDELEPPSFSISVQNHQTGETKTYHNIHLQSARKKIVC